MADKKISALPAATTPLAGTEVLPIVQGGTTDQVSVANLTAGRAVSALSYTATGNAYVGGAAALGGAAELGVANGSSSASAYVNVNSSGNSQFRLNVGGVFKGGFYSLGTGMVAVSTDAINFSTDGGVSNAVTINTAKNIVINTAGKGIDFSANGNAPGMTSEVLTWYEEGTWTPATFTNWSTAPTSIISAKYTRIGRLVVLNVLGYQGVISGSGIITGLPFTVDGTGGSVVIQEVSGAGITSFGVVQDSSTRISGLTAANFTGKYWSFSCSYVV